MSAPKTNSAKKEIGYNEYLKSVVGKEVRVLFKDGTEIVGKLLALHYNHLNLVLEFKGKIRLYRGDIVREVSI